MIDPVSAAQHEVRAGEAGRKGPVLDEGSAGLRGQPFDDARRKAPVFTLASRVMTIGGLTVPHDRFEEVNESPV